jgi:ubiquinone/menaquinone biosynthesis C-methylase UbiE
MPQEKPMSSDLQTQRWLEQVQSEWDSRAESFDELSTRNAVGEDRRQELDFIATVLQLRPGSRLLDAGCGSGQFGIAFAQRGCVVDGVDISPEMIARARTNASAAGVSVTYSVGDLAALDAPDAAYDAIVARMVLQFSPQVSAVLDEFERVAAPNARFWLSVPGSLSPIYGDSWRRFVSAEPRAVNNMVPWELLRLLQERGWSVHEQWGSYDAIGPNAANVAADLDVTEFPLLLQQAAATVWNVIASRDS